MNTNSAIFLTRDRATELLDEADRERLARLAHEGRPANPRKGGRRASARWTFLSSLRSALASR